MTKHKWRFLFGSLAGALVAAAWWLYNHRSRERTPSHESVDDPEVARAYGWVAAMLQMQLLRWFVARRRDDQARGGSGPGMRPRPVGHRVGPAVTQAARDGH